MEPNNWISIFTNSKAHIIEMARQMLENEGFDVQVMNKKDSSYLFGYMYLYVKKQDEAACIKLIEEFKRNLDIE